MKMNSMCLGVQNGTTNQSTTEGTPLIVWPCDGHPDQTWSIVQASECGFTAPGCYVFVNDNSGQVMGVAGGNKTVTHGAQVVQWPLGTSYDQVWCPM